jgi:hypothetical protein
MRRMLLGTMIAAALAGTASAQEVPPEFGDLLRMVPDADRTWAGWTTFAYLDIRAIEAAAGLVPADAEVAPMQGEPPAELFEAWPEDRRTAWRNNIQRLVGGPAGFLRIAGQLGETPAPMVEAVGVDFFAIDRALTFWEEPGVILLAGGTPMTSPEDLQWSSLFARGYALDMRGDVQVLHRFHDNMMATGLRDELMDADPFDGLGLESARVALLPDMLVVTENWADLDTALARRTAPEPTDASLLGEAMAAAALTLDGVEPDILQAWAHPLRDLAVVPDPVVLLQPDGTLGDPAEIERLLGGMPEGPPLPVFPVAMFLDLQAGAEQVNAIALPFPNRADADAAASVVASRLAEWAPNGADEPLVALFDGRIESLVVDAPGLAQPVMRSFFRQFDDGDPAQAEALEAALAEVGNAPGAIAVIAMRYPMPEDLSQPLDLVTGTGGSGTLGGGLRAWVSAIVSRQFTPLAAP